MSETETTQPKMEIVNYRVLDVFRNYCEDGTFTLAFDGKNYTLPYSLTDESYDYDSNQSIEIFNLPDELLEYEDEIISLLSDKVNMEVCLDEII